MRTLSGGIPTRDIKALDNYWQVFPTLENNLFQANRQGYAQIKIPANQIKNNILQNQDYQTFAKTSLKLFKQWQKSAALAEIAQQDLPKSIIHRISEDLLKAYKNTALLNHYDMYQILIGLLATNHAR